MLEDGANRSKPRAQGRRNRGEEEKDPECGHMDVMTAHRKVLPERRSAMSAIMAGLWPLSGCLSNRFVSVPRRLLGHADRGRVLGAVPWR